MKRNEYTYKPRTQRTREKFGRKCIHKNQSFAISKENSFNMDTNIFCNLKIR